MGTCKAHKGQKKVVTDAYYNCFREIQYDIAKCTSKDGQVECVMIEVEQTLKTMLWQGRDFEELCTMEYLDKVLL